MMKDKDGITLSEKHGLNPSMILCLICGKDIGVAMNGRLKDDAQAPRFIKTGDICEDCKSLIDKGYVAMLEVKNEATSINDAEFTGRSLFVNGSVLPEEETSKVMFCNVKEFNYLMKLHNEAQEEDETEDWDEPEMKETK